MIQTVLLRTANLSKECREHYNMEGATHEAQLFIDTELYGMALKGFSVCQNAIYFEELHNEALQAKVRADELKKIEQERQARLNSMAAKEERELIIKSWGWPAKFEKEALEVFG